MAALDDSLMQKFIELRTVIELELLKLDIGVIFTTTGQDIRQVLLIDNKSQKQIATVTAAYTDKRFIPIHDTRRWRERDDRVESIHISWIGVTEEFQGKNFSSIALSYIVARMYVECPGPKPTISTLDDDSDQCMSVKSNAYGKLGYVYEGVAFTIDGKTFTQTDGPEKRKKLSDYKFDYASIQRWFEKAGKIRKGGNKSKRFKRRAGTRKKHEDDLLYVYLGGKYQYCNHA